jgi:hypothetical protein
MSGRWSLKVGLSCGIFVVALIATERQASAHYPAGQNCRCASCAHGSTSCAVCGSSASRRFVSSSSYRHYTNSFRGGGRKYGGAKIRREGLSQRQRSGGIR